MPDFAVNVEAGFESPPDGLVATDLWRATTKRNITGLKVILKVESGILVTYFSNLSLETYVFCFCFFGGPTIIERSDNNYVIHTVLRGKKHKVLQASPCFDAVLMYESARL